MSALAEDTSEQRLGMLFAEYPEASEAVLVYCRARYRAGLTPELVWETSDVAWDMLAVLVQFGGASVRRGFIELGLSGPVDSRLGVMIAYAVKPDELAQAIVDALDGELAERASDLAYHTFDALGDAFAASAELAVLMREKLALYERLRARR